MAKDKSPDQIRKETVPVKHTALTNGLLGLMLGGTAWFGGWALLHPELAKPFPGYVKASWKAKARKPGVPLSAAALTYGLLRFGNEDHRYDLDLLRRGWYPEGEKRPARWVITHANVAPVYSESAFRVVALPLALTALTCFAGFVWGLIADKRYAGRLLAGIQIEGSIVASVDEYNKEVKGDGMRYAVKPWSGR